MAKFSVHFDGPITDNHRLSIRSMAKTYEKMQSAIDRAFLVTTYGEVYKHARLTDEQYAETEFLAEWPQEGGIVLDAIRDGANAVIDRLYGAVQPIFERAATQGATQAHTLSQQIAQRKTYVERVGANTLSFAAIVENPPAEWATAYSDRSIVKEIDQLALMITPERYEGSSLSIHLRGSRWHPRLEFTPEISRHFHALSAARELAAPMRLEAKIRSLDSGNRYTKPKAKILNLATDREVVLHLSGENDFLALHPYHTADAVTLYVCPILEAGGYDLHGGDLQFLAVA